MEAIRCVNLTKRYGDTYAIRGIDLSVEPGQVYGFLGPNGSGKTTTMRVLVGLVRPTDGRAWIAGRRVPNPEGLPRVGTMIEEPAFYPWMTARENLAVLALCGPALTASHAVNVALERVGLADAADRKVKGFSQGMRQRLGLAVALLRDPDVLLLDEPANGLDPAGIREFRTLFRLLADEGKTVFLSSHLLVEVERICDRVAVIHQGRIVEEGGVGKLLAARARVRVVVAASDQGRARELLNRWPVQVDESGALSVGAADAREVNRVLAAGGVWAEQLGVERADLEEAFLGLTTDRGDDTEKEDGSDAPAGS
jgi:ABC-2 type transport system ATP-binding protein